MQVPHRPPLKPKPSFSLCLVQASLLAIAVILTSGCGQTAAPQPPSLKLPTPVADLTASRNAGRVTLTWTMPRRTTDRLLLKGPQSVYICRKLDTAPCAIVVETTFPPEKPAVYEDILPPALASGPPRLFTYLVQVRSRHGSSAGDSNLAYAAGGSAPPAFTNLRGRATAAGVLLQWQAAALASDGNSVNIQRTMLSPPKSEGKAVPNRATGSTVLKEQMLTVHMPPGRDAGEALDANAAFDQRYSYRLTRAATVFVGGKSVELEGPGSSEVVVDTKDVFPPQTPGGLVAVADPEQKAIDLSWSPDTESDLAGYAVYRREENGKPARISGAAVLQGPSFRDLTANPGVEYFYSVTAIDADGNQSAPSAESAEMLPAKP